jgi:hypothetical protein
MWASTTRADTLAPDAAPSDGVSVSRLIQTFQANGDDMVEKEIQPTQWRDFCDQFTQRHRGWLVAVDVLDMRAGEFDDTAPQDKKQEVAHDVPLQALIAVPNPHGASFLLQAGDSGLPTRVLVEKPVRLRVQQTDGSAAPLLYVDSADGLTTRFAFRAAPGPEM